MTQAKTPIAVPVVALAAAAPAAPAKPDAASPLAAADLGDIAASSDTAKAALGSRVTPESAAAAKNEYAEAWGMDPTAC